jgi:hypothetical protein
VWERGGLTLRSSLEVQQRSQLRQRRTLVGRVAAALGQNIALPHFLAAEFAVQR